ncbi:MAG: putative lipid II flippase FtsW [candidate division Zixibacteria bacterium]|nr:putative lipid II flippase FtsW [candidate division Zixibacteria bacterium]
MRRSLVISLVVVSLLLAFAGVLMVFSSSAALAYVKHDGDSMYFLKRHVINLAVALAVGAFCAFADYRLWERLAWPAAIVAVGLLIATLVVGVGSYAAPVHRWLKIGRFFFQPSELAKLATVPVLAKYLARRGYHESVYEKWFPLAAVVVMFAAVAAEPDFSMAFLIAVTAFVMLFLGGVRLRYIVGAGALVAPLLAIMVSAQKYRVSRLMSYIDPWRYARGRGYQVIQSLIALGSGGLVGKGLGASNQKLFYLPQAHTDFVYAVLGEEFGFIGAALVLVAFAVLVTVGFKTAARARDPFGRYLAAGMTTVIGLGAAVNLCVVTGLIPTTGIPLPFISYGGTSLAATFAAVGILISVARRSGVDTGFGYARYTAPPTSLEGTFVDYV